LKKIITCFLIVNYFIHSGAVPPGLNFSSFARRETTPYSNLNVNYEKEYFHYCYSIFRCCSAWYNLAAYQAGNNTLLNMKKSNCEKCLISILCSDVTTYFILYAEIVFYNFHDQN